MDSAYWAYEESQLPAKHRILNYVLSMGYAKNPSFYGSSLSGAFCLIYTESGSATLETVNSKITLSEGSACWIDSNSPIKITQNGKGKPWICRYLATYGPSLRLLYENYLNKTEYVITRFDGEEYRRIFNSIRAQLMCENPNPHVVSLRIYELIMMYSDVADKHKTVVVPQYYLKATKYIKQNYNENISINLLADVSGCSVAQLHKIFKRFAHATPMEYTYDLRFEKACIMLRTTEYTIDTIANECGFSDVRALIYLFRKKIGKTPSTYRREIKNEE